MNSTAAPPQEGDVWTSLLRDLSRHPSLYTQSDFAALLTFIMSSNVNQHTSHNSILDVQHARLLNYDYKHDKHCFHFTCGH